MLVQIEHKGRSVTGLLIGIRNARRYFPKSKSTIDLQLDHLRIQCDLQPGFWSDQPQISDPRLSAWLEAKTLHAHRDRRPAVLALVPTDRKSYRLQLVDSNASTETESMFVAAV